MSQVSTGPMAVAMLDMTVRFGRTTALDRVTMELGSGQVVGLVGPNGAGKTTLLRVLATLLVPNRGRAEVLGLDVVRRPRQVRKAIGYLPDFVGLYQDMRVTEYLRFFADANGLDRQRRDAFVCRSLEMSDLEDRSGDFVEQLSHGMRGKLAFAATLAGDPPVMLLDEPLSGLDPLARIAMRETLTDLKDQQRTTLISSHMLADLERFCDRILFIDRGRLMEEPPDETDRRTIYNLMLAELDYATLEKLRAIDGVESAAADPVKPNSATLELKGPDQGPEVLAAVVALGLSVVSWSPVSTTLEERFRRAVKREQV